MATPIAIKNLHSSEYEHPWDRMALDALRKIPLFPKVVELCSVPQNSITRMELLGSNLKVTERQMPSLYKLMRKACDALDVEEPLFYLGSIADVNAYTACPDKPIVCIYGGLVDMMDDDELIFVIGHELAHIKSQHITYQALGAILAENLLGAALSLVPGLGALSQPAIYALNYAYYEWSRAAELSSDRGGYLACQNFKASCSALMKLAGMSQRYVKELNLDEFIAQGKDFQEAGAEAMGKLQKIILSSGRSHPWSVSRVHELVKFDESGLYKEILARTAPRNEVTAIDTSALTDKAKDAANKTKDAAKGAISGFSKKFGKGAKAETEE